MKSYIVFGDFARLFIEDKIGKQEHVKIDASDWPALARWCDESTKLVWVQKVPITFDFEKIFNLVVDGFLIPDSKFHICPTFYFEVDTDFPSSKWLGGSMAARFEFIDAK